MRHNTGGGGGGGTAAVSNETLGITKKPTWPLQLSGSRTGLITGETEADSISENDCLQQHYRERLGRGREVRKPLIGNHDDPSAFKSLVSNWTQNAAE